MKERCLYIVEDHPVFRMGLVSMLQAEPDLRVCATAASAEEALESTQDCAMDLVIVDVSLPGMSGLDLVRELVRRDPDRRVLVLSMHDEAQFAERAVRAGAAGYLMKDSTPKEIVAGIRKALDGGLVLSPAQSEQILKRTLRGSEEMNDPVQRLSVRELDVFELTGQGRGTRKVAEELGISVKTVETHKAHIKEKLGLESATELVREAVRWAVGDR